MSITRSPVVIRRDRIPLLTPSPSASTRRPPVKCWARTYDVAPPSTNGSPWSDPHTQQLYRTYIDLPSTAAHSSRAGDRRQQLIMATPRLLLLLTLSAAATAAPASAAARSRSRCHTLRQREDGGGGAQHHRLVDVSDGSR